MIVAVEGSAGMPAWLPRDARLYLEHVEGGRSIRALARAEGCHASTVLRRVRGFESRRDDPLVDEALSRYVCRPDAAAPRSGDRAAPPPAGEVAAPAAAGPVPALRPAVAPCAARRPASDPSSKENLSMSAPLRSHPDRTDEASLAREARRILRRLCEPGALLAVAPEMDKAAVLKGTLRIAVVERVVAEAFALKDWIASRRQQGRVALYEITPAGRAALRRLLAEEEGHRAAAPGLAEAQSPFAEQHRIWAERQIPAPGEDRPRRMRYNLAESPLAVLARRRDKEGEPFLTPDLVAAGERLREDFELAQMGPRVAQNWERFLTGADRGGVQPDSGLAEGPRRARDRVAAALRDLGPGLGDMVLRCCCYLEGLETAERRMGWSARSGKIVLRIALMRLRRHYEETYGSAAPLIG